MLYIIYVLAGLGTVLGSYCGYLFSRSNPDGLGYLSMATTILLGVKFLIKPMNGGTDAMSQAGGSTRKTVRAVLLGCIIGWVCGFTGSGGGVLMLMVFSLVLGYNLKVAVGTSTMVMTLVALTGAVSHISMGAQVFPVPMLVTVLSCLVGALASARFANRCEITRLNKIVGAVLTVLGIVTILIKLL